MPVTPIDAGLEGVSRRYNMTTRRLTPAARGAAVVFLDDGKNYFYNDWLPLAEQYGHKLNFPIFSDWHAAPGNEYAGHMSWAQIQDLVARGHEVLNHSKTHTDMTTLTAAQRVAEWDTSQAFITGTIGLSPSAVRNFAYPYSKHNLTIDAEGYLRFGRLFTGPQAPYVLARRDRTLPFVIGRATWAQADVYHNQCMNLIRRAATEDVIVSMITHYDPDPNLGFTDTTRVAELFDLAASLGVPLLTASEAFGAYGGTVPDASFEDSTMAEWTISTPAGETVDSYAITPMVGIAGSRALRILSTSGTGYPYASTRQPIPITDSEPRTFSVKVKQDKSAGSYGGYIFIREYDAYGTQIGTDINSTYVTTTTDWTSLSLAYTPNPATRSVRLFLSQRITVGTTYFDHIHFDRTRFGVLG